MHFLDIGPLELLFIILIALLVLGPHRLPEIARALGKGIRKLKMASAELTKEFKEAGDELKDTGKEVSDALKPTAEATKTKKEKGPV